MPRNHPSAAKPNMFVPPLPPTSPLLAAMYAKGIAVKLVIIIGVEVAAGVATGAGALCLGETTSTAGVAGSPQRKLVKKMARLQENKRENKACDSLQVLLKVFVVSLFFRSCQWFSVWVHCTCLL